VIVRHAAILKRRRRPVPHRHRCRLGIDKRDDGANAARQHGRRENAAVADGRGVTFRIRTTRVQRRIRSSPNR
jgi:hypothetical protein